MAKSSHEMKYEANTSRPNQCSAITPTTNIIYSIGPNINCDNSGIYPIQCSCSSIYRDKTTNTCGTRFNQYFTQKSSTVYKHYTTCRKTQKSSYYF